MMETEAKSISNSIGKLQDNLSEVARVVEWADLMGFNSPKKFSRKFLRHYSVRPKQVLKYIRLKSISRELRNSDTSNFEIARCHGIPDEKALNKFINYHVGCSPSELKQMSEQQLNERLEKFGSKVR